jgi:hypothetical protein
MSENVFDGERGFTNETLAVLVAGVTIPEDCLSLARVNQIVAYAKERRTEAQAWGAVPGADMSNLTGAEDPDGGAECGFTVGWIVAEASSDAALRVEVSLDEMRAGVERARRETAFFEGLRRLFEDHPTALTEVDWNVELWLTSCGPLSASKLVYGVAEPREDYETAAEEAASGELRWHCPVASNQEWQHEQGARGLLVAFAQFCVPEVARIDLSEDAHAARADRTAPLDGERSYYLLSRYD